MEKGFVYLYALQNHCQTLNKHKIKFKIICKSRKICDFFFSLATFFKFLLRRQLEWFDDFVFNIFAMNNSFERDFITNTLKKTE